MNKRAVITGLGIVSPIGTGTDAFWRAALAGANGVRQIQSFDTSDFRTKVGGEVQDFVAEDHIESERLPSLGKSSQYAIAAARMAVADAGLDVGKENPWRLAVSMGTTMGEPQILEQCINSKYDSSGIDQIPPGLPRQYPCGVIPANVAGYFGAHGPTIMIPTACAAGNYAIGYSSDLIRLGKADCVIAGGSDPFSRIAFTGFNRLLATAAERCSPFSLTRDGMTVAEGAGVLVIEELEHARARGAHIYAELLGYGLGCDAFNMTIPAPDGCGGILALKRALSNAQVNPADVDYVCAHGTGTKENDKVETLIAKEVFGEKARSIPMSSLKSMIGHTMGAASAIEAAASVLMLHNQTLLPTINYAEADPECDLDYVPNEPREATLDVVVSNAYAFGGNTSSIVLRRFTG